MATDPRYQPITAEEFLAMDFGSDRKFELVDGVIQMMKGGSSEHAHVSGNIYFALRLKLQSSSCRPFNSDMGVRVDPTTRSVSRCVGDLSTRLADRTVNSCIC